MDFFNISDLKYSVCGGHPFKNVNYFCFLFEVKYIFLLVLMISIKMNLLYRLIQIESD
jgi:hypothetical protein